MRPGAHAFVTGGTGLVGSAVVRALLARGYAVRALARDPARASRILPAGVAIAQGDVTSDPADLSRAMEASTWVFHCAGIPEVWQRDERAFDRVNREGTRHVLDAASSARVARVVYTSTIDVFAAARGGTLVEGPLDPVPKQSAHERSKVAAEREVDAALDRGLDVVVVNPAAIHGPAPVRRGLNAMIADLLDGKLPALPPGGMSIVHVEGVAAAHVEAAEHGGRGERYLVADGYLSSGEIAEAVVAGAARTGLRRRVPPTAPAWLLEAVAAVSEPAARLLGFRPPVTHGQLAFVAWQARVDARKAARALGFVPLDPREGLRRTVEWMRGGAA